MRKITKIISISLVLIMTTILLNGCGQAQKIQPNPVPSDWRELMCELRSGANIGNTFDSVDHGLGDDLSYETAWQKSGVKISQEIIDAYANQGFDFIRIPVSWHNHIDISFGEDGKRVFTIRPEWMNRIKEVVDYCYNDNLYVIINIHHDNSKYFMFPDEEREEESIGYVTQIWAQIANEFAAYDEHLIFETLNEPRLVDTDVEWWPIGDRQYASSEVINHLNQEIINTVRENGQGFNKSRYIMCPGYAASYMSSPKWSLPEDKGGYENRIIASVHAYIPYNFALDTGDGSVDKFDDSVCPDLDDLFRVINENFISKDIPCIIGEWGAMDRGNSADRIRHANYYINKAMTACSDSSGNVVPVPMCIWDNNYFNTAPGVEGFGYLDRATATFPDQELVDVITNLPDEYEFNFN